MYRHVLVPLDGSPLAESILSFVDKIAGPLDMELLLVRVVPLAAEEAVGLGYSVGLDSLELREAEAREYLDRWLKELWGKGIRAHAEVVVGDPAAEIIALAEKLSVDLIAMTTHGRSGLARLVLGSVAEQVVRAAPVPVFVMRATAAAVATAAAPEAAPKS